MYLQLKTSEENCRLLFKKYRTEQGVTCKKCQGSRQYWLEGKWQWQCAKCNFRTTLTSGTVLENTKLPIQTWFLCLHYMLSSKKGMSALEIQRQLGRKRYEPIWSLLHKIRKRMGESEELKLLSNKIEFHLGTVRASLGKSRPEMAKFVKVLCLRDREQNFIKMIMANVLEESKGSEKLVSPLPNVPCFIDEENFKRDSIRSRRLTYDLINLKKRIFGIHHGVQIDYLNNYVSEHSFKRNHWGKELIPITIRELVS